MSRRATKRLVRLGNGLATGVVVAALGAAAFVYLRWVYREQRFNQLIEEVATRQGADKYLIKASEALVRGGIRVIVEAHLSGGISQKGIRVTSDFRKGIRS